MEAYEILIEQWAEHAKKAKLYRFLFNSRNDDDYLTMAHDEEYKMQQIDRALSALSE